MTSLKIVPVTFRQARAFILAHHRHHPPPVGMKFALGAAADGVLVGVATVGRPIARRLDDGVTAEVTRTCTVRGGRGARNANSMLYAAAWRAARAMGYQRVITYTQDGESGASLRAAGYVPVADVPAAPGWHRPSRPRTSASSDHIRRTRWEIRSTRPTPSTPAVDNTDRAAVESVGRPAPRPAHAQADGVESVSRHRPLARSAPTTLTSLHWQRPGVTLYWGDALEVLRGLPTDSVDCVVTSPPYWGLRDYQVAGQYGTEPTVEAYVQSLVGVFNEVARVLTPWGTVWLNLADTFGGSWGNYIAPGSTAATAIRRAGSRQGIRRPPQTRTRAKDLQGVPWRVAFALAERGWWVRDAITWVKPNARPESVRDRLSQRYELLFLLTRSIEHWWTPTDPTKPLAAPSDRLDETGVWVMAAPRSRWSHAAAGPVALAERCIQYGCPPGGVVLDPFSGSGTTGVAARMHGHAFVGIDLDTTSHTIARHRLAPDEESAA